MNRLSDAHCHLHFDSIAHLNEKLFSGQWFTPGLMLVNATGPQDWPAVATIARTYPQVRPAYGIHPWKAADAHATDWLSDLEHYVRSDPNASMGEVGLDAWVAGHDLQLQKRILLPQLAMAHTYNRCLSLHCLRCWDELYGLLKKSLLPERGFIVHAFSGPPNLIPGLLRMGAYFSFNAVLAHPRKQKHLASFQQLPLNRILVETDAPDMLPPAEYRPAQTGQQAVAFNHPGNLSAAYAILAKLRSISVPELSAVVEQNLQVLTNPL